MNLVTSCLGYGLGLRSHYYEAILDQRPKVDWFEIVSENYMVDGGPFHHYLNLIRRDYPLSIHGVGLSIGSESPLDEAHLDRLAALIERYQPQSFSEHLAWSSHGDVFLNDLLPVPYHAASLARVCEHIDRVQERLQRRMLLENPSTYVEFAASTMAETGSCKASRTSSDVIVKVFGRPATRSRPLTSIESS